MKSKNFSFSVLYPMSALEFGRYEDFERWFFFKLKRQAETGSEVVVVVVEKCLSIGLIERNEEKSRVE